MVEEGANSEEIRHRNTGDIDAVTAQLDGQAVTYFPAVHPLLGRISLRTSNSIGNLPSRMRSATYDYEYEKVFQFEPGRLIVNGHKVTGV